MCSESYFGSERNFCAPKSNKINDISEDKNGRQRGDNKINDISEDKNGRQRGDNKINDISEDKNGRQRGNDNNRRDNDRRERRHEENRHERRREGQRHTGLKIMQDGRPVWKQSPIPVPSADVFLAQLKMNKGKPLHV
jgi:hypothetical protein